MPDNTHFSRSGRADYRNGDYRLNVQVNDPCSCGHNNWVVNTGKQIFTDLPSKYCMHLHFKPANWRKYQIFRAYFFNLQYLNSF